MQNVLTSSSPLATYLSLNSRIPCSECFETGSGGVSLVWQITFCNNFTANRRKTTFHNWKEETVWSNSCCNFHIFLLPFFGSEEIISFKSRIFIHIISSNPMLSLQFKERYRYPTSLLRFAKQPSHWTPEIMCVQVSSNLLEGIYVPVKSKLKHPPRAYPGHLTPVPVRKGGHLITTHRGWGIWSLASITCYQSRWFPGGLINHGGDGGDKLGWIQRKRLHIRGALVEN